MGDRHARHHEAARWTTDRHRAADRRVPSLVAAVVRDGVPLWSRWPGQGGGETPTEDTQYRIGSITKTFVGVMIMRLRDEGMLGLSDRCAPTCRARRSATGPSANCWRTPPASRRSRPANGGTQRRQAVGRSGRRDRPGDDQDARRAPVPLLQSRLRRARRGRREAAPHRLVHRRSGRDPGAARHEQDHVAADRAACHRLGRAPVGGRAAARTGARRERHGAGRPVVVHRRPIWRMVGFPVWCHRDVLAADTLTEMREPIVVEDGEYWVDGYGIGLQIQRDGGRRLAGHTGSMPGFLATVWAHPGENTGAVAMANTTSGAVIASLVADLLDIVATHEPRLPAEWAPMADFDRRSARADRPVVLGPGPLRAAAGGGQLAGTQPAESNGRYRFRPELDGTWTGLDGYFAPRRLRVIRRAGRLGQPPRPEHVRAHPRSLRPGRTHPRWGRRGRLALIQTGCQH